MVLALLFLVPEHADAQRRGKRKKKSGAHSTVQKRHKRTRHQAHKYSHALGNALISLEPTDFPYQLRRGLNVSHWLSQSKRRGAEREAYFTEEDVRWMRSKGLDHIRLPIDEEQIWLPNGALNDTAVNLAHNALNWCQKHGLKVVLDLHIIKSHHFNEKDNTLWTNAKEQTHMLNLWRTLSSTFGQYPTHFLAYEILNEPVAPDPALWNKLAYQCYAAIRSREPERWVVIGSNLWQSPSTYSSFEVPENDKRIMLAFHYYEPFLLTHHKAPWVSIGEYKGRVHYPGLSVKWQDTLTMNDDLKKDIKFHNKDWNPAALELFLKDALELSKSNGLPLYCGEWGAINISPMPDRLRWYQDMRRMFEKYHIPWTAWDYKGSFGFRTPEGTPVQELLILLLDQPIER